MRIFSAWRYSSTSLRSARSSRKPPQPETRSSAAMLTFMRMASARNSACCLRSSGTSPMPWRMASRGERIVDRLAVDEDAAGIERIGAEDGARRFGAAGADQPGKPKNLAAADREGDVLDARWRAGRAPCRAASGPRPQARPRRIRPLSRCAKSAFTSRPTIWRMMPSIVRLGDVAAADEPAVAQHRVAVADLATPLRGDASRR